MAADYGSDSKANAIYPRKLGALYRGSQFTLVGRFKGAGPGKITLSGNVAGEPRQITIDVNWPDHEVDNPYLPRVWAMRKVGHLMEDLRLHGNNPEIVQELSALALRHGIVTPYTSQLVVEPGWQQQQQPPPQQIIRGQPRPMPTDDTFGAVNAPAASNASEALAMQKDGMLRAGRQAEQVRDRARSNT